MTPAWRAAPVLGVPNVREAVEDYAKRLGFECPDGVFQGVGDEEGGVYALVERDGASIHLQIRRIPIPPRERQSIETDVYLTVDDVDALHADLVQRGATITQAPADAPYGLREVRVEDCNGYRITFGAPLR